MKKTSILTLAASALLLTGCADEFGGLGGGKETVTFTTVLPTQVTRAYGDNISADKLFCFLYQDGKFVEAADPVKISGNTATVQMQLAKGVTYDVVFWAAKDGKTKILAEPAAETGTTPAEGETTTTQKIPYTYVESTGVLTVDYNKITPNDPYVDAYYSKYTYAAGGTAPEAITLYRPFAQVNVGANDTQHISIQKAYNGNIYSNIEFDAWTGMNLLKGEVTDKDPITVTTDIAKIPGDSESYPVEPEKNKYTNMAYILVPQATSSTINFKCNFYTSEEATSKKVTRDVSNMPVQKNYRTNVYGALLTSTTDFKVEIAPAFYTPDFNNPKPSISAENAEKINNLFADGKNPGAEIDIKVTQPITQAVVIPAQKTPTTVNLNLNGNALTEGITVGDKVILNVTNEAATATRARGQHRLAEGMDGQGYCNNVLFTANNGATINIYGGEYKTNFTGVALANGGTINIYGGRFHSREQTTEWGNKIANATNGGIVKAFGGYFRTRDMDNATLADMGITADSSCKITPHSESDGVIGNIWLLVEHVWHPGVDLATLHWASVGQGTMRDAWLRPSCYNQADIETLEAFEDLTVTIKRCVEYPTLYKIENPYIPGKNDWVELIKGSVCLYSDGEIIFDLQNPSCVPFAPGVCSGARYFNNYMDKMNNYNLEGAAYYNHMNIVPAGTGHSLENILIFDQYVFDHDTTDEEYEKHFFNFNNTFTNFDKATRTLNIRNAVVDITESYNSENNTPEFKYFYTAWQYDHFQLNWKDYYQGYLIFPENFVLLDVYGNPVK